jgi:hypothetical protein
MGKATEYSVYAGLVLPPFLAAGAPVGLSSTMFARATASDFGISLAKRSGLTWAKASPEMLRASVVCVMNDNMVERAAEKML